MRSDRHDETNSRFSENLRTPLKVDLCFRANNKRDDTVVKYMSYSWGGGGYRFDRQLKEFSHF